MKSGRNFFILSFIILILVNLSCSTIQNKLTNDEIAQGWKLLFDGETSNGWTKVGETEFPKEGWEINDGELTVLEGRKGGDIATMNEYSDFELSIDFKMDTACNSGIKYFFMDYPKGGWLGMEYQLLDDINGSDNQKENHLCAALYDIFPPKESVQKTDMVGQWNTALIKCNGQHVEHWLNGEMVLEYDRGNERYLEGVANSKYKSKPVFGMVEKGRIMLQDHGHIISFRNIKIRELE